MCTAQHSTAHQDVHYGTGVESRPGLICSDGSFRPVDVLEPQQCTNLQGEEREPMATAYLNACQQHGPRQQVATSKGVAPTRCYELNMYSSAEEGITITLVKLVDSLRTAPPRLD